MKALQKYLQRYAEPEVAALADCFTANRRYRHILCIPAFNEPVDFLNNLLGDPNISGPLLVVLVVNVPQQTPNNDPARKSTEQLVSHLSRADHTIWQDPEAQFRLCRYNSEKPIDLLLVDRCSSGREIPVKEGVGLARKIGCDIACWLIQQKMVKTDWIHNSDADALLPPDYFAATAPQQSSALIYPYRHIDPGNPDHPVDRAMALYELSLHYYTAGLRWAGSPYAYHSLGSIVALHYGCYARARGFPKKSAAEDFYLLNKLNKIAPVTSIDEPLIRISARPSNRVPFGTGPALININAMEQPLQQYLFYNPQVFILLKEWLALFPGIWRRKGQIDPGNCGQRLLEALTKDAQILTADARLIYEALSAQAAEKAIIHALQHSDTQDAFCRHLHVWFDAFRTLKFIHSLRDRALPSIPLAKMWAQSDFLFTSLQQGEWQYDSIQQLNGLLQDYIELSYTEQNYAEQNKTTQIDATINL